MLPLRNDADSPPYSEDAEHAVLSAMLMDAEAIEVARRILKPESFYAERHKRIFRTMLAVADSGATLDPLTLSERLSSLSELGATGGKEYIGFLVDAVPTAANVEYHAEIVREKYEQREAAPQLELAAEMVRSGKSLVQVRRQLDGVLDVIAPSTVGTSALDIYDDVAIAALPDAASIIADTAYEDSIIVLYGRHATLKTFVLLDMAFCVGTGKAWHGRAVKRGACCYIYAEGRSGIKARVNAWKTAHGHQGAASVYFVPTSVKLTEPAEVSRLLRLIERRVKEPVVAVFVDTLARNMNGDENKVEDTNRFIAGCDRIRAATGASVFVAHHTGWGDGERVRGSTSLPGAVNTALLVERDEYVLTVSCKKQKDGVEDAANITLEAYPIGGSLALRAVVPNRASLTRNERTALTLVQAGDGLTATEWLDASGLPRASFFGAKRRLIALAYVKSIKKQFVATEAGTAALGTRSNSGISEVQTTAVRQVQTAPPPIRGSVVPVPATPAPLPLGVTP